FKHRYALLLVTFLILLIIAVITTGVLRFKQDIKEADIHSSFTDDVNVNIESALFPFCSAIHCHSAAETDSFNSNSTSPFITNAIVSLTDFDPTGVVSDKSAQSSQMTRP